MRRAAPLLIIALGIVLSIVAWPRLPEIMPIHWGVHRRPDGWAPRAFAAFAIPAFQLVLFAILRGVMPVRRAGAPGGDSAVRAVELTTAFLLGFLGLVHATVLAAGLGWRVDVVQIIILGVSALFVGIGLQMAHIPRNPWYGFRLPWTLRSDRAWERTHRVAGPMMAVGGVTMGLATLLRPDLVLWIVLLGTLFVGLGPLVYSLAVRGDDDGAGG